jgi:N-acetylglucosaminyl-diphospho-decaprenol L-rhamnosyltransferase
MDLSIIIVNWNTSKLLSQCLESIYRSRLRSTFEIIVVDNGSTDASISILNTNFPDVNVISNDRNLGFAKANNQGIAVAKGRYILLLNSDTIVLPDAFDEMIRVADLNPQTGVIGPKLLNMDGTLQKSWSSFPSFLSELVGQNFRIRHPVVTIPNAYDVDWIMGACMLVRAATIQDVGKMDEDYFFYSEETDWCFRIKNKNWKIWYLASVEIYHLGGGSTKRGSVVQLVSLYQSKLLYFQKNHGNFATTLLRMGLAFSNTLGIIRRVIFLNWRDRDAAFQRITNQCQLVWYLIRNQYPTTN